jgi:HTH-type transcriptional regulator / antitoxin HipB
MKVQLGAIGASLRARRDELHLTQATVAARIGTTQSYIAGVERGDRDPRWRTAVELARALELEPMFVPRERLAAVQAVLDVALEGDVPPLTGHRW